MTVLGTVLLCALYAGLNVLGASLIKLELQTTPLDGVADYPRFLLNPQVVAGLGIVFLGALVLFKALSQGRFSMVIPLATGINFVLTVAVGTQLFGDRLSLLSYLGLVLILAGVVALAVAERMA